MDELLGLPHPLFTDICIAPESSEQPSHYRKPSPRFIVESIARHQLDPAQCWMVGDRVCDLEAGLNAGIRAVAVCTGKHDAAEWAALAPPGVTVFKDFAAFVETLTRG